MNEDLNTKAHRAIDVEALQSRYALRVTARLAEQSEALPHEVRERLRFARGRALDHARARGATAMSAQQPVAIGSAGVLALGGGGRSPWWFRAAQLLPLLALVAGLVLIQNENVRAQISAAAEIDFDLLVDELPPTAYSDPGFLEFLKAPRD